MTQRQTEQAFIQSSKQALDDSVADLDTVSLARLRQARLAAVTAYADRHAKSRFWLYGMPAAATALVLVGVLISVLLIDSPNMPGAFEDLDLLVATENLDLYEDLDFYAWLAEQDYAG